MFPGGVNPDDIRRMQEQADMARRYYGPVAKIVRRADPRLCMTNVARPNAEQQARMMRGMRPAEQALNSTGLRSSWEAMRRANELAETRFGSEGLLLAGLSAKTGATEGGTS